MAVTTNPEANNNMRNTSWVQAASAIATWMSTNTTVTPIPNETTVGQRRLLENQLHVRQRCRTADWSQFFSSPVYLQVDHAQRGFGLTTPTQEGKGYGPHVSASACVDIHSGASCLQVCERCNVLRDSLSAMMVPHPVLSEGLTSSMFGDVVTVSWIGCSGRAPHLRHTALALGPIVKNEVVAVHPEGAKRMSCTTRSLTSAVTVPTAAVETTRPGWRRRNGGCSNIPFPCRALHPLQL